MSMGEKLVQITENMKNVYGRGYVGGFQEGEKNGYESGFSDGVKNGFDAGYNTGHQDGKKAQYDAFWDVNQKNGTRMNYQYAYVGSGFNFDNFYPKYDIAPIGAFNQAFALWNTSATAHKGSLKKRLESCGVTLDLSKATAMTQAFLRTWFTELPAIVLPGEVRNYQIFSDCIYLETIEKLIVTEKTGFDECFKGAAALKNIQFEGIIAHNGLDFSDCPLLTKESILSILDCLKDYSQTGTTHSVTLGSVNLSKLTENQKAIATQKGWRLV